MSLLSTLREDLHNARGHDPAARGDVENALVYSGLHAIWAYRLAHRLWAKPALRGPARVLTQFTRFLTGIEIHPGRDHRPPVLHRPRHGCGDRGDHRDRRRRDGLPRGDARRPVAPTGQAPSHDRQPGHRRRRRESAWAAEHRRRQRRSAPMPWSPTTCRRTRSPPVSPRSCVRAPRSSGSRGSIRPATSIPRCTSEPASSAGLVAQPSAHRVGTVVGAAVGWRHPPTVQITAIVLSPSSSGAEQEATGQHDRGPQQ